LAYAESDKILSEAERTWFRQSSSRFAPVRARASASKDEDMVTAQVRQRVIHPLHAVFLGGSLPLFFGTLLSDWAYWRTGEVQWINFSAWLLVGALILAGLALAWALIDFLRVDVARDRKSALYILLLAGAFILGFINALIHAKDAWAIMPAGLILSILVFLLIAAATFSGFSTLRRGEGQ
jgi:uncharacterized membrane protein